MLPRSDQEELRRASVNLASMAVQDLESLWGGLDLSKPEMARDELLEVTPKSLRLRKRELDPNKRKRASKQ